MIEFDKKDNACPYFGFIRYEKEKGLTIPPDEYEKGVSTSEVEKNKMFITKADKYRFIVKEIDGKACILRVGKHEYPSISEEKYEKIKRKKNEKENFNIPKESEDNSR